jgi:hypothetical protein
MLLKVLMSGSLRDACEQMCIGYIRTYYVEYLGSLLDRLGLFLF